MNSRGVIGGNLSCAASFGVGTANLTGPLHVARVNANASNVTPDNSVTLDGWLAS